MDKLPAEMLKMIVVFPLLVNGTDRHVDSVDNK